jgi:hypothetical protein
MPAKEKKREQIRRTPKSFRSTIETDLALPLILDARNRELVDAGIDDKVTTSDLFNEWVKNEWVRLREQDKIKQPVVDPYLTDDLGDNYRQRIPLREGDKVVKGYQKTVPNLTIKDLEELHDSGHLKDPQQLASLGGATELHRYEDDRKHDIDCYKTPLGKFIRKWTSAKHYAWFYEPSSERAMSVSRDDVTEEEYEGAKRIGLAGVAGLYWSEMEAHGGQRFWEYGPVVNMVAKAGEIDPPKVGTFISPEGAEDIKSLVFGICEEISRVIEDEADIIKYCLGINGDEHTLQQTAGEFNHDLGYVRAVVYGVIRRACMMRMQLLLPDVFFGSEVGKVTQYFWTPKDKYSALEKAEQFLPVFDHSSDEYQWIRRCIEEEAAGIIKGGKAVIESRENGKDGSEHVVYTFWPDMVLKPHQNYETVLGILGQWEIHAHRGPFDPEPSYVARQKPIDHHKGLYLWGSYPEPSDRGGIWLEYGIDKEDAPNVCLLIAEDGELLDVAYLTEESLLKQTKDQSAFAKEVLQLGIKLDRQPSDIEIARELGFSAATVRDRWEQLARFRQRTISRSIRVRMKMEWMDATLSENEQIQYEWREPLFTDMFSKNPAAEEQFHKLVMTTPLVRPKDSCEGLDVTNMKLDGAYRSTDEKHEVYVRLHKDEGGPLGTFYEVGPMDDIAFNEIVSLQNRSKWLEDAQTTREEEEPSEWMFGFTYEIPKHGNLDESNRHVEVLKSCIESFSGSSERGQPVREWASGVTGDTALLSTLPIKKLNREQLREFCLDPATDVCAAVLAVMCWMGFPVIRAKAVWAKRSDWVDQLRSFKNPKDEYEANEIYHFLTAIADKPQEFPDYGGFYSCIAHFLDGDAGGCIMNFRTSIGVNLICGHDIVPDPASFMDGYRLRWPYSKRQRYHSSVYKHFNKFVRDLAKLVGKPADLVIDVLMDNSDESCWREHLLEEEALSPAQVGRV